MKTKFLTIIILTAASLSGMALLLAGISSCKKDDLDPQKAIIGKWDFVAAYIYPPGETREGEPSHYYEFFPDGRCIEYYYKEERYYEGTYKLEFRERRKGENKTPFSHNEADEYWFLFCNYDGYYDYDGSYYARYYGYNRICEFRNKNEMTLFNPNRISFYTYLNEVYKLKK